MWTNIRQAVFPSYMYHLLLVSAYLRWLHVKVKGVVEASIFRLVGLGPDSEQLEAKWRYTSIYNVYVDLNSHMHDYLIRNCDVPFDYNS